MKSPYAIFTAFCPALRVCGRVTTNPDDCAVEKDIEITASSLFAPAVQTRESVLVIAGKPVTVALML
jgi:hypothetical protein